MRFYICLLSTGGGLTKAECDSVNGDLKDGLCYSKSGNFHDNHPSHNPGIQREQQYNPGKDQYLTEKYRIQDIPSNQRPWNP